MYDVAQEAQLIETQSVSLQNYIVNYIAQMRHIHVKINKINGWYSTRKTKGLLKYYYHYYSSLFH